MAVNRCAQYLTSSTQTVLKGAVTTAPPILRTCPLASRRFNTGSYSYSSAKRKLQTTTAYRPQSLNDIPPPPSPRNVGVPDTSIAGAIPKVNETRPPTLASAYDSLSPSLQNENRNISLPEAEAQQSKPVVGTFTPSKLTKPRLKPRKAAISLTSSALQQLRKLLSLPEPKMIRIGVKNRGCSGLAYHLEYVDKPMVFDEVVEQDNVKVLVDSKALFSIIGSEMDWVEDKLNQRFVFRNPNIKEQCGCGESFMV